MSHGNADTRRRRALFLDRDGVINVDHGYVCRIEDFAFIPGIFDLVRYAARDLGWPVIVVSNQSGIGRGYFDEATHQELTDWMLARFEAEDAPIARAYHAPHHPEHGVGDYRADHPWRKPKPGMLLQAAADFDLDLPGSAMIGDRLGDMQAAEAAGIGLRILLAADGAAPEAQTYRLAGSLAEALAILKRSVPHAGG